MQMVSFFIYNDWLLKFEIQIQTFIIFVGLWQIPQGWNYLVENHQKRKEKRPILETAWWEFKNGGWKSIGIKRH